jgi:O-antigen/teichoic acid export membrane protein
VILQVFGKAYAAQGSMLLQLLSLAIIPNICFVLCIGLLRVQRRILQIFIAQGSVALLTLALSYLLLPRYGIAGVGWAWLVSQSLAATVAYLVVLRPIWNK